jgi:predicted DNA-binding ribbon-helix-helix protein
MVNVGDSRAREQPGQSGAQVSTLDNRNVTVAGHRTSIRLEPAMWDALRLVCERERASIHEIVTAIERARSESSLTSAIRVFLLRYFMNAATEGGHWRASHGTLFARSRSRGYDPL